MVKIMIDSVIEYSKQVKRTANSILNQSKLIEILEKYGQPELTGSYAFDLMYGPDIDITVVTPQPKGVSRAVLADLLDQDFFQRYEYGNFVRFVYQNRPKGYILVLAITIDDVYWEIEIWFLFKKPVREEMIIELIGQALTPRTKEIILKLKHERALSGIDKHRVPSVDIYEGVLKHKVYTLDDIEKKVQG